jgi:hypothetical protein
MSNFFFKLFTYRFKNDIFCFFPGKMSGAFEFSDLFLFDSINLFETFIYLFFIKLQTFIPFIKRSFAPVNDFKFLPCFIFAFSSYPQRFNFSLYDITRAASATARAGTGSAFGCTDVVAAMFPFSF